MIRLVLKSRKRIISYPSYTYTYDLIRSIPRNKNYHYDQLIPGVVLGPKGPRFLPARFAHRPAMLAAAFVPRCLSNLWTPLSSFHIPTDSIVVFE